MATRKTRTTETLRETLFEVMDRIMEGTIEVKEAKAVCDTAGRIIESAELEISIAEFYAKHDAKGTDVSIGRHLLCALET